MLKKTKIEEQLPLEQIFGFCKTFEKVTEKLAFHSTFKTAILQDIIFTTIADKFNLTFNSLYLFVQILKPSTETHFMFNESIQNNYRISYDDWYTERGAATDSNYHADFGRAQSVNSPLYVITVHLTAARLNASDKNENPAIFDNLDVGQNFVEIDELRYQRYSVLIKYTKTDYIDQLRYPKLFYKEYLWETSSNPVISHPDMKTKSPIQILDLRLRTDLITPKRPIIRTIQKWAS